MSNITIVHQLFVPLRYLQFLKIIRSTAAAAENEPCQVCPIALRRPYESKLEKHRIAGIALALGSSIQVAIGGPDLNPVVFLGIFVTTIGESLKEQFVAGGGVLPLVERFDIEPYSDFSSK